MIYFILLIESSVFNDKDTGSFKNSRPDLGLLPGKEAVVLIP